jgi:cytochrome c oxidase assembly protein subunit 15
MTFLARPAALLALCLVLQVVLGIFVVWQSRPPILTTMHVLNGAALLATSVLLAMRISRSSGLRGVAGAETFADRFEEAHA